MSPSPTHPPMPPAGNAPAQNPQSSPDPSVETSQGSRFHLYSFLVGLLTALLLVGGTLLLLRRPQPAPIVLQAPPTPAPTSTPLPTPTPGPITVFVSGAVAEPGLVSLPAEARVGDALVAAGGLRADADPALVNQAQLLWDGAQVHVPAQIEAGGDVNLALLGPSPPVGVSGAAGGFVAGSLPAGQTGSGRININTASAADLETLPGVGATRAQAIIDNRPYASVEDLQRVSGIGPKTLESMLDLITVD